ncbi:hypothetical protein SK128_009995 [Halocaridina rubra]|uniref:Alpha-2-macroglobulin domain-containing protein n=1 Tax=Halocaridina rubra TaxID=373956 RepID=A0AAN8XSA5_HALRR
MVRLKVPNTPANWLMEGYAIHPEHGLMVLPEQSYDSTPPLMMKLEATSFCRRGEQVSVRVHLFNSDEKNLMVMVVLKGNKDYRFINVEENAQVNYHRPRLSAGDHQHLITLRGRSFQEVMMPVAIVKQMGTVIITIYAITQTGRDVRRVKVTVEPEGALVRYHTSVLLDLKNRGTVYEFLDLPIDESPEITRSIIRRYVYGSPNARLAVTGDVFGPVAHDMTVSYTRAFNGRILKSCDGYAFNFGTTLWSLHYLRLTNQLRISKAKKAFDFLNVQLATLLARYKEGGFRMWFASKSSIW